MRSLGRLLFIGLLAGAASAGGCSARGEYVAPEDVVVLHDRIVDLERSNGRLQVQVEELEERLFLMQDRVEANRLAMMRRDAGQRSTTIPVGPQSSAQARRAYQPLPTAAAPQVRPVVDPMGVPQLPVQRVGPAYGGSPASAPTEDVEEVVVDMAAYHARFGSEPDASPAPATRTASAAEPVRRAQPPVDTGGRSLPVTDSAEPNGAVRRAAVAAERGTNASGESGLAVYRRALDEFNAGEYAAALTSMRTFIDGGPQEDYMDNALFWMGECYYGLGRYGEALGFFQRVVSEYPDGNKVPDSLLKVALSYERLDDVGSAREVLTVLAETYPTTDAARRATERLRGLE